jgi:phosphomethylpyrimidine synthase
MNANEKFIAADAHVDEAAIKPLPNSRKIYVCRKSAGHSRADARGYQADTDTAFGGEKNPPIYVYDCSGPYSDPQATSTSARGCRHCVRSGLPSERTASRFPA